MPIITYIKYLQELRIKNRLIEMNGQLFPIENKINLIDLFNQGNLNEDYGDLIKIERTIGLKNKNQFIYKFFKLRENFQ